MRLATLPICLLLSFYSFSQQVVDVSKQDVRIGQNTFYVAGGQPYVTAKFVNLVEGTPYFKDEWLNGIVVDGSDHQYKDIQLKIDLMTNTVHYLDKEKDYVATNPIKEIVLTDTLGSNYRFVHSLGLENVVNAEKGKWYLWLSSGAVSLYKKFEKNITEFRPYGSATTQQSIKTREQYLIVYNNTLQVVKKIKDLPSMLPGKKKELQDFLKSRDDEKAPMDDRMIKLIDFYNFAVKDQKTNTKG